MLERLDAFLGKTGTWPVVVKQGQDYIASAEWGQEAPGSPMAGAAAYGLAPTLEDALDQLLRDAGC